MKKEQGENTSIQGYFRSQDGIKLFYSCEGPSQAPPLLFCYGLVCSKLQWKYQMEYFKTKYRVIYMDYRGHGKSESPREARSVTIENLAKDLAQLCDELKLEPALVLGHSLGVNIILEFYRLYPEKVAALVLASGTPKDPFETMFHHNFLQSVFPLLRLANDYAPEMAQKMWEKQGTNRLNQEVISWLGFNRKYSKREDINEYLRLASTVRFDISLHLLTDFTKYDSCQWLDQVKCPTLVVGGEDDMITPIKNQRLLHKLIKDSEFKLIPEGSHCPQLDKPAETNEIIERFVEKVFGASTVATLAKPKLKQKKALAK